MRLMMPSSERRKREVRESAPGINEGMRTSLLGVEGVMDTGEHTQTWERSGNENTWVGV